MKVLGLCMCFMCCVSLFSQNESLTDDENLDLLKAHASAVHIFDVYGAMEQLTVGPDGEYCLLALDGAFSGPNDEDASMKLWTSKDLCTWVFKGYLWNLDGKWWFNDKTEDARKKYMNKKIGPKLKFVNDTCYVSFYSVNKGLKVLKSTTGKVDGPYVNVYDTKVFECFNDKNSYKGQKYVYDCSTKKVMVDNTENRDDVLFNEFKDYEELEFRVADKHYDVVDLGIAKVHGRYLHFMNTNDLGVYSKSYLSMNSSKSFLGKYKKEKLILRNSFKHMPVCDNFGKWWAVASSHPVFGEQERGRISLWLVPLSINERRGKVSISVLDSAFIPSEKEQEELVFN